MKTPYPSPEQVSSDFGQDFLLAFIAAVSEADRNLATLRKEHPDWAVTYSQRFYANFLHERIWGLMLPFLLNDPRFHVVNEEPHREFSLQGRYRGRFKKHDDSDGLRSYPTHSAIEFFLQPTPLPLDEIATYPLAFGYNWDSELNQVRYPLFSLRESLGKATWVERLHLDTTTAQPQVLHSPVEPELPGLEVILHEIQQEEAQ
ncbi:MAG: hypothetical protein Q4C87_09625 [Actinomycetaceae bacterium]|nr:hypothetical protein [Actinomycetaceae bacterium]